MLFLAERVDLLRSPQRVLHFAAEPGVAKRLRDVRTLDYMPADLDPPRGFERVDATDIRVPGQFDGVIAMHVLEHIPDDRAAMREFHRVLRPGGWAFVMVPIGPTGETYEDPSIVSPDERQRVFGQHDHVRVYGWDVEQRLRDAGFEVELVDYADILGPRAAERHGITPLDFVHFCVKR